MLFLWTLKKRISLVFNKIDEIILVKIVFLYSNCLIFNQ